MKFKCADFGDNWRCVMSDESLIVCGQWTIYPPEIGKHCSFALTNRVYDDRCAFVELLKSWAINLSSRKNGVDDFHEPPNDFSFAASKSQHIVQSSLLFLLRLSAYWSNQRWRWTWQRRAANQCWGNCFVFNDRRLNRNRYEVSMNNYDSWSQFRRRVCLLQFHLIIIKTVCGSGADGVYLLLFTSDLR